MHATYIIYSASLDRYYIGSTSELERRLSEHRSGESKWTSQTDDWELVFRCSHADQTDALAMEREIKRKKSRRSIQRYVAHPKNECQ